MPPKKKKRTRTEEDKDLESFGIYEDDEKYDDEVKNERESWRDVG